MLHPARRTRQQTLGVGLVLVVALMLALRLHSAYVSPGTRLPPAGEAPAGVPAATGHMPAAGPSAVPRAASVPAVPPVIGPIADGTLPPVVHSSAAVVLDGDTGAVLYDAGAHRRLPPASITKIVTAMVAIERGDLDAPVTVDIDSLDFSIRTDSTVMGLEPGDTLTLRDLLYGMMLPSGNDAAIAIAEAVAGSEQAFVVLMNAKAAELGLRDTHFTNPHGLNDPDHYTSAYDIAQLGRWAMSDPRFREIVGAREWIIHGSRTYTLYNNNNLLTAYPDADGIKIGWHEEAGPTIVGSAVRNGHRVIVALLNAEHEIPDTSALLDWAFGHFSWP